MNIDFSEKDVLLIYGHFIRQIKELETLKASPSCPIHKSNLNQDIKLFSSITGKIEAVYPNISKLAKHL